MDINRIWIYVVEDCGYGVVFADNEEEARKTVINAYLNHYIGFDPECTTVLIKNAIENNNVFSDSPDVVEVFYD